MEKRAECDGAVGADALGPDHALEPGAQGLDGLADWWLRTSVSSDTRRTDQVSNACASISRLASTLMPVRWADAASHVYPMSTTSGVRRCAATGCRRPTTSTRPG